MRNDFHAFAEGFLESGKAPGMLPLPQTSDALLEFLGEGMASNPCTVFITHDFFAAVLMHYLGIKAPDRINWCAYLEGVCLIACEEKMTFRHFHNFPR